MRPTAAIIILALSTGSCVDDEAAYTLDEFGPEMAEEFERLRRRMNIRVYQDQSTTPTEVQPGSFEDTLEAACTYELSSVNAIFGSTYCTSADEATATSSCAARLCRVQLGLCVAHRALEISHSPASVTLTTGSGTTRVPPQSTASNAALQEIAYHFSRRALINAAYGLREGARSTGECKYDAGSDHLATTYTVPNPDGTQTLFRFGETMVNAFVEAYHLAHEAAEEVGKSDMAVADAAFSESPSVNVAARRAQTAPVLSRAHAAHMLFAYNPNDPLDTSYHGLKSFNTDGLFSRAPLSRGARDALEVFRETALPPSDIDSILTIDELLTGGTWRVAERFGDMIGDNNDISGAVLIRDMTTDEFVGHLGLTKTDFQEARLYLISEHRAFGRSTVKLAPRRLAPTTVGGAARTTKTSGYDLYAATSRRPASPPPAYWAALVRASAPRDPPDVFGEPTAAYAARGLAQLVDFAASVVFDLVDTPLCPTAPNCTGAGFADEVRNPLAIFATDVVAQRPGRIELSVRRRTAMPDEVKVRLLGFQADPDVLLVRGAAGLQCAATGRVDGVICDLDDPLNGYLVTATPTSGTADPTTGFGSYTEWTFDSSTEAQTGGIYAVRRRSGGDAGTGGDYAVLGGTRVTETVPGDPETGAWAVARNVPLVPHIDERGGRIVEPSPTEGTSAATSCAGVSFGQRLPLEDELTDDGSAYESSFRHYLGLARAAAQEADMLGEELIALGLEIDRRSEDSMEELERICGASVDIDGITLRSLSGTIGSGCAMDGSCGANYTCVGRGTSSPGTCVIDPVKVVISEATSEPDRERLRECLSESTLTAFASLGSEPVCVWYDNANRNLICAGATESMPCPAPIRGSCATMSRPAPASTTPVATLPLGFFGSPTVPPMADTAEPPPCDLIRYLRHPNSALVGEALIREAASASVIGSRHFRIENVRRLATSLSFQARAGDFASVRLNGGDWLWTGTTDSGPSTQYPCAAPTISCTNRAGLFCDAHLRAGSTLDCNHATPSVAATNRAWINDRLARAVLAARITTGSDLAGMELPARPAWGAWTIPGAEEPGTDHRGRNYLRSNYAKVYDGHPYDGSGVDYRFSYRRQSPVLVTCIDGTGGPFDVWRRVRLNSTNPALGYEQNVLSSQCNQRTQLSNLGPFVTFDWGGMRGEAPASYAINIWRGMGGSIADSPPAPLLRWYRNAMLPETVHRWGGNTIVLGPDTSRIRDLTHFWLADETCGIPSDDDFGAGDCHRGRIFNEAEIAREGLTTDNLLDGLELLCEAARAERGSCTDPPAVDSSGDLSSARAFMQCVADDIEARAEMIVFANIPDRAIGLLAEAPTSGAYPAVGGEYAVELARVRQGLVDFKTAADALSAQLDGFASDMDLVRNALMRSDVQARLGELDLQATVIGQLASCASSVDLSFGALASCANSAAQISIAIQAAALRQEELELASEAELITFQQRFNDRVAALNGIANDITRAEEAINGGLAQMEVLRTRARRVLAKGTFFDSDPAGRHYRVGIATRRRYNTALIRYRQARDNAIRMTYLAKRAVEQRLGMALSSLTDPMTLVPVAPARWESRLCMMSGIDYERIRSHTPLAAENFVDGYLTDYVRDLENVVESYRIDYPFTDAMDTAVISLRDEVRGVRAPCPTEVGNLLLYSGRLDTAVVAESDVVVPAGTEPAPVWAQTGCNTAATGGVPFACVAAVEIREGTAPQPLPPTDPDFSRVPGYRIKFGPHSIGTFANPIGRVIPTATSFAATTKLVQYVDLAPGRYRLSWYGRRLSVEMGCAMATCDPAGARDPKQAVRVYDDGTGAEVVGGARQPGTVADSSVWVRYYYFFDIVGGDKRVRIAITPDATIPTRAQQVDIGAVMLEDVTARVLGAEDPMMATSISTYNPSDPAFAPLRFVDTRATPEATLATCEDTTGTEFRRRGWEYECIRLGDSGYGYGRLCEDGHTTCHCYWKMEFAITQASIEAGRLIRAGGFALGNYNYRFDGVALNVVGSAARECEDDALPSTCFSAGFVPVTLDHHGPYNVRNHRGELYEAPLFVARIEHARALAAERYVTNPISGADRALLEPYTRRELRGRPLDGNYTLRIWDVPGVNFHGIEDVQLVLTYRYWTRFE